MYYTGIGSRKTPPDFQDYFSNLAVVLEASGYTLRSGAADGADAAFEKHVTKKEIYLPWRGFNNHPSHLHPANFCTDAPEIAESIHPNWDRLTPTVRKLHLRNVYQVLGRDLQTPSSFVISWTPGAADVGGTRTALVLAKRRNIPTIQFGGNDDLQEYEKLRRLLNS